MHVLAAKEWEDAGSLVFRPYRARIDQVLCFIGICNGRIGFILHDVSKLLLLTKTACQQVDSIQRHRSVSPVEATANS